MRFAWATDIHLNHASPAARDALTDQIARENVDALLITGDIAEAQDVESHLISFAESLAMPIYFVLGNHDFYGGSIDQVRQSVTQLCEQHERLHYLNACDPFLLNDSLAVVGEDGWGDGREGDFNNSPIQLNDFYLIKDFAQTERPHWKAMVGKLGDESARRLRSKLLSVAEQCKDVIILTHVPPLRESCWYEGQVTTDDWAPFFVCRAVGDCLCEVADQFSDTRFLVLCGHTHNDGEARIRDNLHISTAGAFYERPEVDRLIDTESFMETWPPLPKPRHGGGQDFENI